MTTSRPWLERTGQARTYKSSRRELLQRLVHIPKAPFQALGYWRGPGLNSTYVDLLSSRGDKEKLSWIMIAIDRMLDRYE
jgi:hypothetical protein